MVCVASALGSIGCGSLLGIDDGLPDSDAEADSFQPGDVVTSEGGGVGDAGTDGDGNAEAGCTDPTYCNTHCGTGLDNCGKSQPCTDNCHGTNDFCDASSNTCDCTQLSGFCDNKCGDWTDNCGNKVTCNGCDGGGCTDAGLCASCTPNGQTCGSRACGFVNDGCTQLPCGTNNGNCPNNGECDAGACCTPLAPSVACAGKCNAMVSDGCWGTIDCSGTTYCGSGQVCDPSETCCTVPSNACGTQCQGYVAACGSMVPCSPSNCAAGQECDPGGQCCTPTGCGAPGQNNCGQPDPNCAPDSGDGGACGMPGQPCTPMPNSCCGGLYCENNGTCGPTVCGMPGGSCMGTSQCCAGLHCSNGLATPAAAPKSNKKKNKKGPFLIPDAGGPDAGVCQ
jgi:hypothetical protein